MANAMEKWLGSLSSYWPAMRENGFDSTEILELMTPDQFEEMYRMIGMTKAGHKFHLKNKVAALRGEIPTPVSPPADRAVPIAGPQGAGTTGARKAAAILRQKQSGYVADELATGGGDYRDATNDAAKTMRDAGMADPKDPEGDYSGPSSSSSAPIPGSKARPRRNSFGKSLSYSEQQGNGASASRPRAGATAPSSRAGSTAPGSSWQHQQQSSYQQAQQQQEVQSGWVQQHQQRQQSQPQSQYTAGYSAQQLHSDEQPTNPLHDAAPYKKLLAMLRESAASSPVGARVGRDASPSRSPTLLQRNSSARLFLN